MNRAKISNSWRIGVSILKFLYQCSTDSCKRSKNQITLAARINHRPAAAFENEPLGKTKAHSPVKPPMVLRISRCLFREKQARLGRKHRLMLSDCVRFVIKRNFQSTFRIQRIAQVSQVCLYL